MAGSRTAVRSILAALALLPVPAGLAHAGETAPDAWTVEKCVRYEKAFGELLAFVGPQGVSEGFIRGNRDFIAAGCSNGADVCPTSDKDIELANALTIAAMSFGTASSFLPFVCRSPR
ncbi:hypothetical protein M8R20_13800 [Pseudomonas sp. R2.Fl]|nr:hypothetical protein [Pseudomonas sp. R2.Fl]